MSDGKSTPTQIIVRHLTAVGLLVLAAGIAWAQIIENAEDPFLYSVPYERVRLVHSTDPGQKGTSAHLRSHDPFLLYQLGRDMVQLSFRLDHGAYGNPGALDVPLYVGTNPKSTIHGVPARFARDHTSSCGMCHSGVFREPAGGHTIASTGGLGRNTSHFYGAGLVEMLGEQVRTEILLRYDTNGDGLFDRSEVEGSRPVRIEPFPGAPPIDYGDLAPDKEGVPQLNSVFRLWYVDSKGQFLPRATSLADPGVAAFGLAMQPFGWGRGQRMVGNRRVSQGGESSTLREFYTVAADFHMGLQAYDPTQQGKDPAAHGSGGLAGLSLNGAQQFDFGGSVDRGQRRTATGLSLDDPDRDGHFNELSEGDIDAAEFYLLNTPAPAVRISSGSEAGRAVLHQIGCTRCHIESWQIRPRDDEKGFKGDRRFFNLAVGSYEDEEGVSQLWAVLEPRYRKGKSGIEPIGDAFDVDFIYTDFKHWDLGAAFHERRFDGTLQRLHRTAPLWGVGSTAPYGHAGNFLSLHEVIMAHGGAAKKERDAYRALEPKDRELLLEMLRSLVLYSTDEIPADIDNDGEIADEFLVAKQKMGYERFDARFLFAKPPRYRHLTQVVHHSGRGFPLALMTNIEQAYGLDLPARRDQDNDGFPDIVDPLSTQPGIRADGEPGAGDEDRQPSGYGTQGGER